MKVGKEKKLLLMAVLFSIVLGICPVREALADYTYRMSVTVQSSQVQSGPQPNFPFLFSSTSANLRTVANGGGVTNANGYDIIFKALDDTTCGGTGLAPCTLSHEIEKYDGATGEFIAWVRVPSIDNGTVIYAYYGNSSISTSQENKTDTWDTNYKAVWHLPDGATLTANDSTNGGNDASSMNASAVSGKIGGGASFDGAGSNIQMANGSTNFAGNITLESWVYPLNACNGCYRSIVIKNTDFSKRDYAYFLSGYNPNPTNYIFVSMGQTNPGDIDVSSHPWSAGAWNHIVATADGSNIKIYINGNLAGSVVDSHVSTTGPFGARLGEEYSGNYTVYGYLDEVRISNYARSADWIKTEYNNQSAPSSFYTLGSQLVVGRFNYRMPITVNSAQLPSSQCSGNPLTDFPFLFNTTSTNLRTVANSGHVESSNGYDIIFRALDSTTCTGAPDWDGSSCTLNHEIEKYDGSTGEFVAWVKVPSINNGTVIYVYYGNPGVTSSAENKTGVWDGNYKGVWHLPNTSSATFSSPGSGPWTVPAGVTSITVKAWGGGGGAGAGSVTGGGGGGGFAQATLSTTPGESLTVYVGGGGSTGNGGGGGGGYSAVTRGSTYLIQAGGGGGAGEGGAISDGGAGGAGGGGSGVAGTSGGASGGGGGGAGTNVAVGSGGSVNATNGSANQGGAGGRKDTSGGSGGSSNGGLNGGGNGAYNDPNSFNCNGGGGGGGRFGGGGGGGGSGGTNCGGGAGGGGGSDLVTGTNTVETAGSGTTPGNTADPDYPGSVGVGGSNCSNGNAGYVVITWGSGSNPAADSTINANNGTVHGATGTAGQIDGALSFASASSQYISTALTAGKTFTWEAWFNTSSIDTNYQSIVAIGNANYMLADIYNGAGSFWTTDGLAGNSLGVTGLQSGTWYHLVFVRTADSTTGGYKVYLNGSLTSTQGNTGVWSSSDVIWLGGRQNQAGQYFNGSLDELRASSTARPACWIATEYNNQYKPNNPSNPTDTTWFYKLDSEESSPPTLITLASFDVSPQGGIEWQTKSEVDNLGFNLYRVNPDGTGAVRLNSALIPGLLSSAIGKEYAYADTGSSGTVCYMLEDIDLAGASTYHGPVCTYQPAPQSADGTSGQETAGSGSGSTAPQAVPPGTASVTEVRLQSLKARHYPEGVLIEWQTGYEVRNLGFHVYRDEGNRRIRLNRELLAGSALLAGTRTILRSGNAYSWFDARGGTYWIEDVDLSGKKTLHGPIVPIPAEGPLPQKILNRLRTEPVATIPLFKILRMLTGAHAGFPGGSTSPLETQWALAGTATMKLLIRQEGWYRLSFAQLAQAGFTARPQYIQLYVDGKEQPILVTTTGMEFYATGLDTPWSDTRTYWLVNGIAPGKRIAQAGGVLGHAGPASFPYMVEAKPRSFYFAALLNGEASNWFGPMITQNQTDVALTVSHSAPGEATLEVLLQGATEQTHTVGVSLNGSSLGSLVFDGQTQGHALFPVTQLTEGVNQVSFTSSGEEDISLVDTLRLTYQHTYTADGDHLRFTAPGGTTLTLKGLRQPVKIIDSTDPSIPQELSGYIPRSGGVQLRVPGKGTRTLFAVAEQAMQAPQLLANIPSTWHTNHQADLVIITHGDFASSVAPLVQLRQSQGLSVAVVDIEDLYDEFTYGQKNPYAVKAFLTKAKSWTRPPRYVLLVGNATYDPRNYTGSGDTDFVPTKLIDTAMIETASDDWFVDVNIDGLPEIPIGRIPAVSASEASQAVAKLIAYEQNTPSTKALYVADIGDAADDFEGAIGPMESLTSLIPDELFRSQLQGQTAPVLLAKLAEGAGLVLYLGHGSVQLWDNNVLDTTSAATLTNTTFPFFIALTCLNGYFIIPAADSLATTLLTDGAGGAVGVIASSSLTEFAPQSALGTALLTNLFTGATVGEALVAAKHAVTDPDVRRSYLLFGDPSMRVRR